VFSEIWYGLRPATREHDERMRGYLAQTVAVLSPYGTVAR
jgi:hypothetical protein